MNKWSPSSESKKCCCKRAPGNAPELSEGFTCGWTWPCAFLGCQPTAGYHPGTTTSCSETPSPSRHWEDPCCSHLWAEWAGPMCLLPWLPAAVHGLPLPQQGRAGLGKEKMEILSLEHYCLWWVTTICVGAIAHLHLIPVMFLMEGQQQQCQSCSWAGCQARGCTQGLMAADLLLVSPWMQHCGAQCAQGVLGLSDGGWWHHLIQGGNSNALMLQIKARLGEDLAAVTSVVHPG